MLAFQNKITTFALAFKKHGSVAQLNRASDYGSEGSGFESQRSHNIKEDFTLCKILFFRIYSIEHQHFPDFRNAYYDVHSDV